MDNTDSSIGLQVVQVQEFGDIVWIVGTEMIRPLLVEDVGQFHRWRTKSFDSKLILL